MFKKLLLKHDIYLSGLLISLLILGLFTLYSSTKGTGINNEQYFTRQAVFAVIGTILYFFTSFVSFNIFKSKWSYIIIYLLNLILLIAVLLFTAKVKGASRWFVVPLPFLGSINIQPADIAKIVVVLVGSYILTHWRRVRKLPLKFKSDILNYNFVPYFLILLPILGLVLIQPALGTTIIIFLTLILVLYFAAPSKNKALSYFLTFLVTAGVWSLFRLQPIWIKLLINCLVIFLLWFSLFRKSNKIFVILILLFTAFIFSFITQPASIDRLGEYQKDRINCWIDPTIDPSGICFQQIQARIAIGSGQLFGRGFSQGLQVREARLPEFQNDFIYAAFAEQYGFIGTIFLLSIYFLFLSEIFRISTKQKSEFSRVVILGIGIIFLLQVFINISMNNGLLPTTGISLPFMSYGGSFLWVSLISVGIIQNLSHQPILVDEDNNKYVRWDDE